MRAMYNEQENFWAGEFGNEYIVRNKNTELAKSNLHFFSNIIKHTKKIDSIIEFGANIGLNLMAFKMLLPDIQASAVEINEKAIQELQQIENITAYHQSIIDYDRPEQYDLAFVKGVLIHINPSDLTKVYDVLYRASKRYVLIAEYYNPTPAEINYRGHQNKLFKRDFCGEMLDRYPNLALINYGFAYHRDQHFPQDDITWFLLEKDAAKGKST